MICSTKGRDKISIPQYSLFPVTLLGNYLPYNVESWQLAPSNSCIINEIACQEYLPVIPVFHTWQRFHSAF